MECVAMKAMPQEVQDYASDQVYEGEYQTLPEAAAAKLHDMLYEVRHGERDDYDRGTLQGLEDVITEVL